MFLIAAPIGIALVLLFMAIAFFLYKKFSLPPVTMNPEPLVKIQLTTASTGHTNAYFLVDYVITDLDDTPVSGYVANFILEDAGPYYTNHNIGDVTITSSPGSGSTGQLQIGIPNPFGPKDPNNEYPTPKLPIGKKYEVDIFHTYGSLNKVIDPPPPDNDLVEPREP